MPIDPLFACIAIRLLSVNVTLNWVVTAECCSGTQNCSVLIQLCELVIFVYLLIIELLFEFACFDIVILSCLPYLATCFGPRGVALYLSD